MDDIVKRIRQQSYFGLEPYEAADEIEQLRQRVQELEKERDRLSELCDKWNFECDEMREDNKRLANVADALKQQRDEYKGKLEDEIVDHDCHRTELTAWATKYRESIAERDALKLVLDSAYKIADCYRDERDKATQYWQIAEGRCDALKQQRDELVAALYVITKRPVIEAFSIAKAAIASVKEK